MNIVEKKHDIKAIIGLGNPGSKYYYTRHSVGFRVLDSLATSFGADWKEKDLMHLSEIISLGKKVFLVKPQTFMNNSGKVIPFLLKKGIKPENIIVVHDELEFPFGKVAIKFGGSARGHNGLRSIIDACGNDFYRVRCGIARPENREFVAEYVLKPFDEPESVVDKMIQKAEQLIISFLLPALYD